ncbi:hypothetical protein AUK10_03180 [Candidatus Gracilibacteria bacterium CG2_30_37_12]|nr:MAG: hypothetical protein AUK10_03180 [Candidatus Gracilibacteria bacterium CG2_30_37_12]
MKSSAYKKLINLFLEVSSYKEDPVYFSDEVPINIEDIARKIMGGQIFTSLDLNEFYISKFGSSTTSKIQPL